MSKTLLVYTDEPTGNAVKRAVGKKGSIVSIESLSQLHAACRNVPADALFIGEEEWNVFGYTALHPMFAPHIHFPIIMVIARLNDCSGKREMIFRFVSIPEEQRNRAEAVGYYAVLRPFLRILSPVAIRAWIKISGPEDPLGKTSESEREKQVEIARGLCAHKKCRDIFDLILSRGEAGASADFIQRKIWPDSLKSHRSDIQSYVCKIRKSMREHPECYSTITWKDRKYFFVQTSEK